MIDFILWCAMFGAIVGIGQLLRQCIALLTTISHQLGQDK